MDVVSEAKRRISTHIPLRSEDDVGVQRNMTFTIIAAYHQETRGIGAKNQLPWHVPEDLQFFRKKTRMTSHLFGRNAVILGRSTLESFHGRLLPGRIHVCLTSQSIVSPSLHSMSESIDLVHYASSLNQALEWLQNLSEPVETIFVIGGSKVYQEAIHHPQCAHIWVNELTWRNDPPPFSVTDLDSFFPIIDAQMYQEIPEDKNEINTSDATVYICTRHYQRIPVPV